MASSKQFFNFLISSLAVHTHIFNPKCQYYALYTLGAEKMYLFFNQLV